MHLTSQGTERAVIKRVDDFDPDNQRALDDPEMLYGPLREKCPVARSSRYGGFWAITRYEDVERVMSDPETFTSSHGIIIPRNPASGRRAPLHYDPPEHTVFRKAINPIFRKDRLRRLSSYIHDLAHELIPPPDKAGPDGLVMDWYGQYCSPFSARVVCRLLNIPEALIDGLIAHIEIFEDAQRNRDTSTVERENQAIYSICRSAVEERSSDRLSENEDLVSALLAIKDKDPSVDFDAVVGSLRQIVVAGHGAPALVLASSVLHLSRDADLQSRLRKNRPLIPSVVEEMLRLHTPNIGFSRTATRDVAFRNTVISAGDPLALVLPAANRDPRVFDLPNETVPGRPEHHLAFGVGPHVCPGSVIGREELSAAIDALLSATSSFSVEGEMAFSPWPTSGPTRLPLRLRFEQPTPSENSGSQ